MNGTKTQTSETKQSPKRMKILSRKMPITQHRIANKKCINIPTSKKIYLQHEPKSHGKINAMNNFSTQSSKKKSLIFFLNTKYSLSVI